MISVRKAILALTTGNGALVLTALTASAGIVCSENLCWHTPDQYSYPPDARIVIHDDSWLANSHVVFHEHGGEVIGGATNG